MSLHKEEKQRLLTSIMENEGFDSLDELLEECMFDSICPCICTFCGAISDLEPDQDRGWCDECETNTVVSALVIAGVI